MHSHTGFFPKMAPFIHTVLQTALLSLSFSPNRSGQLSTCLCLEGSLTSSGGLFLRHSIPFELFRHPLGPFDGVESFSAATKSEKLLQLKAIPDWVHLQALLATFRNTDILSFSPFFKFQVEVWCWIKNVARGCLQGPQAKTVAASARGDPQVLLRTMATHSWHLGPAEEGRDVHVKGNSRITTFFFKAKLGTCFSTLLGFYD